MKHLLLLAATVALTSCWGPERKQYPELGISLVTWELEKEVVNGQLDLSRNDILIRKSSACYSSLNKLKEAFLKEHTDPRWKVVDTYGGEMDNGISYFGVYMRMVKNEFGDTYYDYTFQVNLQEGCLRVKTPMGIKSTPVDAISLIRTIEEL